MISDSTQSILAAHRYIGHFMRRDAQGFFDALDDNVSCLHHTIKDDICKGELFAGKEKVSNAYLNYFFSNTINVDFSNILVQGSVLHATITYEANLGEKEDEYVHNYCLLSSTDLDFKKEENNQLKIVKIWERVTKNPV